VHLFRATFAGSENQLNQATLYFFCGKMGAGKSTQAKKLAAENNAVLISEDEWLSTLYPQQINTFDDYLLYSARLKPLLFSHVASILQSGSHVVMDFPGNTSKQRKWFAELASFANSKSELVYLQVSDEICLAQIARRRTEQPERAAFDTESVFRELSKYFQEPDASEGLSIRVIEAGT